MGFFSSLKKAIKKVVAAPAAAVAGTVRVLGTLLTNSNAYPVFSAGYVLEEIGETIMPKCYREEEKSTAAVIDVTKDCKTYYNMSREKLEPQLNQFCHRERNRINDCKEQIQLLIPDDVFERVKKIIPEAPFEAICKECWDDIAVNISVDNEAFKKALSIVDSTERQRKCGEYVSETVNRITNHASRSISKKATEIIKQMLQEVIQYMDEQKATLSECQHELDEMQSKKDDSEFVVCRMGSSLVDIAYLNCITSVIAE